MSGAAAYWMDDAHEERAQYLADLQDGVPLTERDPGDENDTWDALDEVDRCRGCGDPLKCRDNATLCYVCQLIAVADAD